MTAAGYTASSQSWAETIQYGVASKVSFAIAVLCTAGGWLVAPPLSIVAMVFLVIGMVMRTRRGELTVTWTATGPGLYVASSRITAPAARPAPGAADQVEHDSAPR